MYVALSKRNIAALVTFGVFYLGFGVLITLFQERSIYQPWAQDFSSCEAFREASNVTHLGTRMYVQAGKKGVVVLYHGNAGSACDRAYLAEEFVSAGYGYVVVEYAGYSNDPRRTTHERVKEDVRAVVDYLASLNIEPEVVVGESVGSGPASYHASLRPPRHLLLISPFASLSDVARRKFWMYPSSLLVDNAFDNVHLLATYEGPVTVLHGESDRVVSHSSGKYLFDHLPTTQKYFVSVPERGHNDLFTTALPYETVRDVLEQAQTLR